MAEISPELKTKIQRVLGIHASEIDQYDPAELIDELCETVFMLDEGNAVAQLTVMRDKLTSINGRIWNLLGYHDSKKAREDFSGISALERYVGDVKRKSGKLEDKHQEDRGRLSDAEQRQEETERYLRRLEERVKRIQEDLQNLFHTLMEVESMEEEANQPK